MKYISNVKLKDNILFGLLFFFIFGCIGFLPLKSGGNFKVWPIIISMVFLTITILRPNLFTFINRLWIRFGMILGKIISPILMGLIFFLVVTPIGVFIKILKKDLMHQNKKKSTYWIQRERGTSSMKKQF